MTGTTALEEVLEHFDLWKTQGQARRQYSKMNLGKGRAFSPNLKKTKQKQTKIKNKQKPLVLRRRKDEQDEWISKIKVSRLHKIICILYFFSYFFIVAVENKVLDRRLSFRGSALVRWRNIEVLGKWWVIPRSRLLTLSLCFHSLFNYKLFHHKSQL